jgi:hypothetical protein
MCVKIRFRTSASARYESLNPKYRRRATPTAWIAPAITIPMRSGQITAILEEVVDLSMMTPTRYGMVTIIAIQIRAPRMDLAAMGR